MKEKVSVTVDKKALLLVEEMISSGVFRNRSHAFEFALQLLKKGGSRGK